MKTANIVILESSDEFLEELKSYFDGKEEFNVCAVTGSGNAGIGYIDQYKPDAVIHSTLCSAGGTASACSTISRTTAATARP